jgi:hypothetical protein
MGHDPRSMLAMVGSLAATHTGPFSSFCMARTIGGEYNMACNDGPDHTHLVVTQASEEYRAHLARTEARIIQCQRAVAQDVAAQVHAATTHQKASPRGRGATRYKKIVRQLPVELQLLMSSLVAQKMMSGAEELPDTPRLRIALAGARSTALARGVPDPPRLSDAMLPLTLEVLVPEAVMPTVAQVAFYQRASVGRM